MNEALVQLDHLWLTDFRSWPAAELALGSGLTVVRGRNGAGKTNLLEAAGYLATLSSFRGAPAEALVRHGTEQAVVRGEGRRGGRTVLVEVEIRLRGRGRVALNRQPVRRTSDLLEALRVSVFSPDDLVLVKGPPAGRRRWLDETLVALHPRYDALRRDFERVVRQRTSLLGQAAGLRGRLTPDVATTLDVWDAKLTETGEALARARVDLLGRLQPSVAKAYGDLATAGTPLGPGDPVVGLTYEAPWMEQGLAPALAGARSDELRRGVSLVGPHRDDVVLAVGNLPARTHASQGEQRTLALALRLAAHTVVAEEVGEPPLLLLDDVFSELDADRSGALLEHLPSGQAVLTTTGAVPEGAVPERVVRVVDGRLVEEDGE
ncbi:MAG TPA: DNA replication/repair protein RecF [Acidimicrobiales bacterium]|nr:DNA replication/repair protein RecF [Acidimicrobiales bacterium]